MKKLIADYRDNDKRELWVDGVLYNFIYGVLGAVVIVAITIKSDMGVLVSYLLYYFFLGKIVNRPKYVTDLGKFIVFPIPTALGAFIGYKLGSIFIDFL
ncbi:MAG: hypothetical protein CMC48_09655 [Flavobacteriaceae bacterium]|nr:hypothetical protein [Flavobacteriaceae bacterium]|tara:strand:+ start:321 stop:617 length:297 start_codon:yes stop_codon:yes gene_type:complete